MKVLYIGSRADEAASLNLEREVTDLQRRFGDAIGEPVNFTFLPRVLAEELAVAIARTRPDVLHISAHGTKDQLALTNEAGAEVPLTAQALRAYLPFEKPPRVVYLNACDSHEIAKALADTVPMAIGITAPITNRAARTGAAAFYSALLDGASVARAFDVAMNTIGTMQAGQSSAALYPRAGVQPENEFLHRVPRIVADFVDGRPQLKQGRFLIRAGVVGCPANTVQLIVFTDDSSFVEDYDAEDPKDELATHLCYVIRRTPIRGVLWTDQWDNWWVRGDFRLFATGVAGDGTAFTIPATLVSDAIEHRYRLAPNGDVPADIAEALVSMRRDDGSELDYAPKRRSIKAQHTGTEAMAPAKKPAASAPTTTAPRRQ